MGLSHCCCCVTSKVNPSVDSEDDSSRGRKRRVIHVKPLPASSGTAVASASPSSGLHPQPKSLVAGHWLLLSSQNLEAYDQVTSVTDIDINMMQMLRRYPNIHSFEPTGNGSDEMEWSSRFEGGPLEVVKATFRLGEEFDEMSPGRQRTRSVYHMPDINTMAGTRTYRNGIQTYIERTVLPSNPNTLIVTLTAEGVTCTRLHRRLSDGEYAKLVQQPVIVRQ